MLTRLRRFLCGLQGHDSVLHFEEGRVSLLCTSCGHETPGWDCLQKKVAAFLLVVCLAPTLHAQSISWKRTAEQPTAAQAAAVLKVLCTAPTSACFLPPRKPDVPASGSTASTVPTLGPWDFPAEAPRRRLDGTLLTDPPAQYGSAPLIVVIR